MGYGQSSAHGAALSYGAPHGRPALSGSVSVGFAVAAALVFNLNAYAISGAVTLDFGIAGTTVFADNSHEIVGAVPLDFAPAAAMVFDSQEPDAIVGAVAIQFTPGVGAAGFHYRDPLEFRTGEVVSVFIDGALLHVMPRQTQIELALGERSTARFLVVDELLAHRFFLGQEVEIYDTDAVKLFGGVVFTSKRERPQKGVVLHHVACVDYTWLTDNVVVAETFTNKTAGQIVRELITEYLEPEGIFLVNAEIEDGPLVGFHFFDYVSLTQAFNDLSDRSGMWWRIDPNRSFQFLARGSVLAPWNVVGDDEIQTATIDDSSPGYRNVQVMRNVRDETPLQLESFAGDGQRRAFTVRYPIARVPTVILNSVQKTVGIKGVSTGKDWYWASGDGVLAQDDAGAILTTADVLEVAYVGFIPTTLRFEKESAVAEMQAIQGFGTGRVERVEAVAEVTPKEQAVALAHEMVDRWSEFGQHLEYLTKDPGLFEGMMQQATIAEFALNDEMLLERVTITPTESVVWYRVHAVTGPLIGSWSGLYRSEGPYAEQKEDPKGGPAPEIVVVYHDDPGPIQTCELLPPPDIPPPTGTTAGGSITVGGEPTTVERRVLRVAIRPREQLAETYYPGSGTYYTAPLTGWEAEIEYVEIPLTGTESYTDLWIAIRTNVGIGDVVVDYEVVFMTDPPLDMEDYVVSWRVEDYSPNRIDIYERECEWVVEENPCVDPKYLWDTREQGTLLEDTTAREKHLEIDENGSWQADPPMRVWTPPFVSGDNRGGGAASDVTDDNVWSEPVEDIATPFITSGDQLGYTFSTVYDVPDWSVFGNDDYVLMRHFWYTKDEFDAINYIVIGTLYARIFEPQPTSNPGWNGVTVQYESDETFRDDGSGEYTAFDFNLPNGLHSVTLVADPASLSIKLYVDGVLEATVNGMTDLSWWPGVAAYAAIDFENDYEPPHATFADGAMVQWFAQGQRAITGKQGLSAMWACGQSGAQVAEWHDFLKTIYPGLP